MPSEPESVRQLVERALGERGMGFEYRGDSVLRIPHGSAEVFVEIDDLAGASVVRVSALVLDELELESEAEINALRAVNDRNRTLRFAKFTLEQGSGSVTLEYDLLGDHLQPEELINAVTAVARTADDHDDLLREELGRGRRAADR